MPSAQFDPPTTGSHGLAISNLVVRLLSEYTGRGPTKARTHFNDNLITVVLQNLLSEGRAQPHPRRQGRPRARDAPRLPAHDAR